MVAKIVEKTLYLSDVLGLGFLLSNGILSTFRSSNLRSSFKINSQGYYGQKVK